MKPISRRNEMDVVAGKPVPDSQYVRAFCRGCGAAMRVSEASFLAGNYADCSDCERPFRDDVDMHDGAGEYDGTWDNIVRAMEDAEDAA